MILFKNNYHTFGDSHSQSFPFDVDNIHWIGPVLCYSFGKENLKRCDISKFNVKDNDTVIFCFGEIDCRCHIHKHISENNTYIDIINNLVKNYVKAIQINIENFDKKLRDICIFNIPPPPFEEKSKNSEYPFIGSPYDRKKYVLYFNKCLKKKCIENNWVFFDIYKKCINKNGFLDKNIMCPNGIHIDNHKLFIDFLVKHEVSKKQPEIIIQ
tara:strand:- start:878 stop:1513 length:636 start_codon:yes stop_codon:yes gene_type:complete